MWQEEVKVIVMLTEVEEQGQRKSEQYWPDQGNLEYVGPFRVMLADQQVFADYIIRTMQVMVSLLFHLYSYHTMNFELHRQQYAIFPITPIPLTPLLLCDSCPNSHLPIHLSSALFSTACGKELCGF